MYCKVFGGDCTLKSCAWYRECIKEGNILPLHPAVILAKLTEVISNES